jgi:GTP-binding protein EngB required for normal cell division
MNIDRPSLLTRYDNLRRKTFESLNKVVDTLGKVNGLPQPQLEQARDALFHSDHPFLIVLIGAFNTGKSSLINALIGEPMLPVGAIPTTSKIGMLRHGPTSSRSEAGDIATYFHPAPLLERVSLVDTPGLDSIFKGHDEITRKFLHRADLVLLAMMSTQALSASNLGYLQSLKDYGKRVIVVINQIDLIDPPERETLQKFVAEQGKQALGEAPTVWLVSAKWAAEAQKSQPRDGLLWKNSGFDQIENFVGQALSDSERVRQKLQTPLQITRNVLSTANETVRLQQDALATYRQAADNVRGQIDASTKAQEATLQETLQATNKHFDEAANRGQQAIGEMFQWSKAMALSLSGFSELIGFSRLARRLGRGSMAKAAFDTHNVDEPLANIMPVADRLPPRLEGRDIKDADDLVHYTRQSLESLPEALRGKIIGPLNPPTSYDRAIIKSGRASLEAALDKGRAAEFATIDKAVRNTITSLGVFLFTVLVLGLLLLLLLVFANTDGGARSTTVLLMIVLFIGAITLMPIRGILMRAAYGRRMVVAKAEFATALAKFGNDQIAYGRQLRLDAVAPFLRMVETQIGQVDAVKAELLSHETTLTALEAELGGLGK